jgi:transcriptional regulator with XRE-family HTH domain
MTKIKKLGLDFLIKLKENKTPAPNDLTRGMGVLIRKARESNGWNQNEFAEKIASRQSTISDIEQGKNEIGVLTLAVLALVLQRPISYFFPAGVLKNSIVDITSTDQQELLDLFKEIEHIGGGKLALKQMELLYNHYMEDIQTAENGYDDFPPAVELREENAEEYDV